MRVVPSRSRRLFVAAAATVIALGACSTTGADEENPASSSSAAAGDRFPVTITTAFGDVTIEKQPTRVVTLGWSDAEVALALGVQPVGDADWIPFGGDGQGPWNQGKYTTPPVMVGTLELDMEKIAALNPDLILDTRASGKKDRYDQIAALGVPVVDIPPGGESYKTTWDQQLEMVGKALGRTAEAAELKSGLEAQFAAVAAANPQFKGKTVAAGSRTVRGWGAYVGGSGRVDFLAGLGFTPSPAIEALKGDTFSIQISDEKINTLDADLTTITMIGITADEVKGDKLLQSVPSVSAGHVVYLDNKDISSAFASNSVLGYRYALETVPPLLAAALG
ncbi:ABC transporter substrate-binding protein [Catenuloplanes japonicus]|uniref:ABC transporter substrate-binding protein n=1 Tax=Catenuloplanes japonicus TaxID=33876 RepID=UPI0005261045|nr:ABC transporter substrate-binding protein [Catenuloplanes japonicus]